MASVNLRNNFPSLIVLLQNINNKTLVHSLVSQRAVCKALQEIALNFLLGNVRLTDSEKAKLRPFQLELEQFVQKKRSLESKVALLLQYKQKKILLKALLLIGIPTVASILKDGKKY